MSVFVDGGQVPRPAWWATLVAALVVALLGAGIAYGTHAYATEHEGRLLPGVTAAGVDLGGMTAEEAVAAVEAATAEQLDRTVTLRGDGQVWRTTPRELGSTSDAESVVADAMDASRAPGLAALARMRFFGDSFSLEREVTVDHSVAGVQAFVDEAAAEIHVPAQDAELHVVGESFEIAPEANGQVLDTDAAVTELMAVLEDGGDRVGLAVHPVQAERATTDFRQVLVLRQSAHTLELFENGQPAGSWDVAVGESGHSTPTGIYEVTLKRHMPTWVNPSPGGWGSGMPARIGPGVNNPLGVRALNWNAPAIRFHGTANVSSIGTNASKGCVRLTNADVVELYDLVDVGATIVSIG